jgi:hypothetical protein
VIFHLPNYPDVITPEAFYYPLTEDGRLVETTWSRVLMEHDEWEIIIEPYANIHTLIKGVFRQPSTVLSGVGQICRRDGSEFNPKHVLRELELVRVFLSFAFAAWKTPLFIIGSNSKYVRSVQRLTPYKSGPEWFSNGWLPESHGHLLADAYPGFCRLWEKQDWLFPVTQAITWLIEAATTRGSIEGAIAFCQIPLEMFAWNVFVGDRHLVSEEKFDNLAAADKFHLLLDRCGIPIAIPPDLTALTAVAKEAKEKFTGPQLAVSYIRRWLGVTRPAKARA